MPPNKNVKLIRFFKRDLYALATALCVSALTTSFPQSSVAEAPPQMFGVNLSGPEAGGLHSIANTDVYESDNQPRKNYPRGRYGFDYNYPTQPLFSYYRVRGITLVRLPLRWERLQHSQGAVLDPTEIARLDACLASARAEGMQVILDLHNYNHYHVYKDGYWTEYLVNSSANPGVTKEHFANFWQRIAQRYANEPAIYGYDLMNEPKGTLGHWAPSAQAAVNAIRVYDKKHWILIEGVNWSGAQSWVSTNPDINNSSLNISDSANKLIYSAHSYWDRNFQFNGTPPGYADRNLKYDGKYSTYAQEAGAPNMGITSLQPFVNWINSHGYNGLIGEYGVPWQTDAASWSTVLDQSMSYLKTSGLSGTYWSGGAWMGEYHLSCQANPLGGADRPSMTTMRKYSGIVYEVENATRSTSGDAVNVVVDDALNQGKGDHFLANAAGDYIIYTLANVPAGTYNIYLRCKKHSSRGRFQLATAGPNGSGGFVNQGPAQDLYYNGVDYVTINVGPVTFTTTSDKQVRLTITGKNANSTGYNLLIDYIQLQK